MTKVIFPSFEYEKRLWDGGYEIVAGADEVGRGCFAGPVVAAAVAFPKFFNSQFYNDSGDTQGLKPILDSDGKRVVIRDSKTLSERQRNIAESWIRQNAIYCGVGEASVEEINEEGISASTFSAFRRAVGGINLDYNNCIQFLLVDAYYVPNLRLNVRQKYSKNCFKNTTDSASRQLAIKKGDRYSFSISAASIVAKVYRDNLMKKLGKAEELSCYGWCDNKGYGTKTHRDAIVKYGITKHHRKQFVDTFLRKIPK